MKKLLLLLIIPLFVTQCNLVDQLGDRLGFGESELDLTNLLLLGVVDHGYELSTSRTSGTAPLAVRFETTNMRLRGWGIPVTGVRENGFTWDYGNDVSENWTNGESKNSDPGFLGAHLYETPGTYTVNVSGSSGTYAGISKQVTITVADPDVVYSGTNTICVSKGVDFTGCPSGAQQVTLTKHSGAEYDVIRAGQFTESTSETKRISNVKTGASETISYTDTWNCTTEADAQRLNFTDVTGITDLFSPGKRILFRRSEVLYFYEKIDVENFDGGTIGAFGACGGTTDARGICSDNPDFRMIGPVTATDMFRIFDGLEDIRIQDLRLSQTCGNGNRGFNMLGASEEITFNRMYIEGYATAIVGRTTGQKTPHRNFGLFNSNFEKMGVGTRTTYTPTGCDPVVPDADSGTFDAEWAAYKVTLKAVLENEQCREGGNVMFFPAEGHMIMGNLMNDARTKRAEHILRLPLARGSLISHNTLTEPSYIKHALKIHHGGDCLITADCDISPVEDPRVYATERVLIYKNIMQADADIVVQIGPGTSRVGEVVQYIVFTDNTVESTGTNGQLGIAFRGKNSLIQNNTFNQKSTEYWLAISVAPAPDEEVNVTDNWIWNNLVTADLDGRVDFVQLFEGANGAQVLNNRICSDSSSRIVDEKDDGISYTATGNTRDNCP